MTNPEEREDKSLQRHHHTVICSYSSTIPPSAHARRVEIKIELPTVSVTAMQLHHFCFVNNLNSSEYYCDG